MKNFKNIFFLKYLFHKIVYPNYLKYSKFDAKSISENLLLLSVVEKKSYRQIKNQKFCFKPLYFVAECL